MDIQFQVVSLQELADSITKRCYVDWDTNLLPPLRLAQLQSLTWRGSGRPDKMFASQLQDWIAEDN